MSVRISDRLLGLFLVLIFGIYSMVALANHARYQTYGYDLGIYDQLIWKYAQGMPAKSSLYRDMDALGIHFQPILYLISPLYRIIDDVRALLVLQVAVVVAAGYPLFLIAKEKLQSAFAGTAVVSAYLFYFGTQRGLFLDFHTDSFFPLLFSLAWLGFIQKKFVLYAAGVLGLLLLKEWTGAFVATLGIVLVLGDWTFWRWALFSVIIGIGVFLIAIYGFILPLAGPSSAVFGYGELGGTPLHVARTLVNDPLLSITHFFWPVKKLETFILSLFPFGPWLLLSPVLFLLPLEQFALRFWDLGHPYRWGTDLQYSMTLGPLFAVGTISGLGVLRSVTPERYKKLAMTASCSLLFILTAISQYVFHVPVLGVLKREFYTTPSWYQNTSAVLAAVPEDAKVAAQNNLAPHLSHRDRLYVLPVVRDAQFIVVDLHPGQSLYNFMTQSEAEMHLFVQELEASGKWRVQLRAGDAILLKRV